MNLFRKFNQNRFQILIIVLIIVFIIIILQLLNAITKKKVEKERNEALNNQTVGAIRNETNTIPINEQVTDNQVKEDISLVIDQFIKYCNNNDIEKAYNLLSKDCKENIFNTQESFYANYYIINFKSKRLYSKELYTDSTYTVKLYNDILSTGESKTDSGLQDLYTIVLENNEPKLNIASYIGRKEINKKATNGILTINVVEKNIYEDYEEYTFEVTNNTVKTVLLDSLENTKSMYLINENDVNRYSYSHELNKLTINIKSNETKTIKIKYSKAYGRTNYSIKAVCFTNIINDYEEYEKTEIKSNYKNISALTIDL